jgi:cyclin L
VERLSDIAAPIMDRPDQDISAACLYLIAKLSPHPQSPRNILNVYAFLLSPASPLASGNVHDASRELTPPNPKSYYLSEGTYFAQRAALFRTEAEVLRVLGFQTHTALPYTIAINYLQALDVFGKASGPKLSQRTLAHLTSALLSPQLLYLTHQPPALATAAIYLSARDLGVKLPAEDWWEVFDVDREELGFLVVALRSMEGFVKVEQEKWQRKRVPMAVEDVERELEARRLLEREE